MISLRPYQQKFIDDIRNSFRQNKKRVVGVAPCGAGKTIMTGWMIRESALKGKRSIFFVHRQELIKQTAETFSALDIPHGFITAGKKEQLDLPVQIASVQTLANRIKDPEFNFKPDFLICDECHHILANTYKKIIDKWHNAFLLGVTATPQRIGGINLGDVFEDMVKSLNVDQLIQLGNLTPFKYFAPVSNIDLSNVRIDFGEFNKDDLAKVMKDKRIIGNIVDNYRLYANNKSSICYCVNVSHSMKVAKSFLDNGISAAHVDGDTPKYEREALVEDFRTGKIKVLCNAELFSEGFDVPRCQAVILARPTASLTLYIQQAMRSMRPDPDDPNKVAVIIDHVQNYLRHGYPNKLHKWKLDNDDEKEIKCPACKKSVLPIINKDGLQQCPECGYIFVRDDREHKYHPRLIEEVDGDISQADNSIEFFINIAKQKNRSIGWAAYCALDYVKSYNDCLHIADICGYKKGWAFYKWREIQSEISQAPILQKACLSC